MAPATGECPGTQGGDMGAGKGLELQKALRSPMGSRRKIGVTHPTRRLGGLGSPG